MFMHLKCKTISMVIIALLLTLSAVVFISYETGFTEAVITEASVEIGDVVSDSGFNITKKLISNGIDSAEKIAYLTFDDGPSQNTLKILDALNEYGAKATFFLLGETAERNPDIVKRIYEEGHTIGNHSYTHIYNRVYGTREEFLSEISMWENAVGNIIGKENLVKLFRFPGGSKEDWKLMYRNISAELGYNFVDWTALNGDADGKPFSKERCMQEIEKYCTGTKDVIILMHDSAKKTITAEMMPEILEFLKGKGYTFRKIEI